MDERGERHLKRTFVRFVRSSKKLSSSDNLGSSSLISIASMQLQSDITSDRFEASFEIIR